MSGPGISDSDDFNNHYSPPQLKSIPRILEGKKIKIPTLLNWKKEPEPIHCATCVPAYAHAFFIINGIYILKWSDAINEAKRIQWNKSNTI